MTPPLSISQYHLYAKKLNNSAAVCIEIRQYSRAIVSLTKALQLSKAHSDANLSDCCTCCHCCLSGCIAFSENNPPVSRAVMTPSCRVIGNGCIYQRPIRIPHKPIYENHNMGSTLFLIITFNLALAHHLSAVTLQSSKRISSSAASTSGVAPAITTPTDRIQKKVHKALQLYELSHKWHSRLRSSGFNNARPISSTASSTSNPSFGSIRFAMIISNNLGHTHLLVSNYAQHRQHLEDLLSAVMLAIEYKTRSVNSGGNNLGNASADNATATLPSPSTSPASERQSQHDEDLWKTDLDGFLMSASPLFLHEHCAEAA
mmetsp:Transcript_19025/g.53051  ORF Transcript_19025/g.53051 Transcript_19025/m.53051 type:complete len:317 (-) Transcript_19025:131-1081(-)|eukprot:CAMPEP_0172367844 /NCGR_PEP_ID=MMETSP1060-20121228/23952_1 /TAXON_ID=37318 /ORGANISM="Pseudo-nitzschia pungens, Strain cf. cingulata" /LENGTH=316 /DNA_ID=CAMNT_0013092229 /DNA_START=87 /DNA_END=1037 /DNA_ORIENTATION=-